VKRIFLTVLAAIIASLSVGYIWRSRADAQKRVIATVAAESAARVELLTPDSAQFCPVSDVQFIERDRKLLLFGWVDEFTDPRNPRRLRWGAIVDRKTMSVEMATYDSDAGGGDAYNQILHRMGERR
jgi:hypothetical protein